MPFDSVHGLFGSDLDPSCPEESIRRHTIDVYRREGELSLTLGGPKVIVHPAPLVAQGAAGDPDPQEARIDPLRRSLADLAETGRQQGVTYLIENVPNDYAFGSNPRQLAELLREVDQLDAVAMCFDTGHAHITGDCAAALRSCFDVAVYMHITDNEGESDQHLIPGEGTLDWELITDIVRQLPGDTPAMLELFESEAKLAQTITDGLPARLRQWLALEERCPARP